MVRHTTTRTGSIAILATAASLAIVALVALLTLGPPCAIGVAAGQDEDEITAETYDVEETARLSVSPVGNVIHKDVLVYDREFFDSQSANFEEYPFLLSRRYRAMEEVNEIQDFRADLDKAAATVTLTFRETGRAYNMGDYWIMYGFSTKPTGIDGRELVIEEKSTVNSDYTLWQDLDFKTTTYVSLPQGAEGIRWDEDDSAVVWEMPAQLAALTTDDDGVLQDYRAVFIALFAVLMAGSLGVAAAVLLRGRQRAPVAAATVPGPSAATSTGGVMPTVAADPAATAAVLTTMPVESPPVESPPVGEAPAAPSAGDAASPPSDAETSADTPAAPEPAPVDASRPTGTAEAAGRPHFCRYCGVHLPDIDARYCPTCGKDLRHKDD
jgi:hypothetical protein